MHYLVTGHTGFKGSWLVLLLESRGHTVSGLSLDPVDGSLFERAGLSALLERDLRIDIRDAAATQQGIASIAPEVVIHLAAQPLVRESYREPRATFETNIMGTLNVIDAAQKSGTAKAQLVVTTDKVYRNVNQEVGYSESDPLGGDDPYSSSKAMADILTHSWATSFPGIPTAIARAGNVIGGGDVSADRLFPDLLNSYAKGISPKLRYPHSVRPWQHVLDCLNGYLTIADALLDDRGQGAWNIGPGRESFVDVATVADLVMKLTQSGARWTLDGGHHPHEAGLLALDASKAQAELGWHNRLSFTQSVEWTVDWDTQVRAGGDAREITLAQIATFEAKP